MQKEILNVFISMPFSGKTEKEIKEELTGVSRKLEKLMPNKTCVLIHNWYFDPAKDTKNRGVLCLGEAIRKLSHCDAVIFLEGWQEKRGCKIEREIAESYGIPIWVI